MTPDFQADIDLIGGTEAVPTVLDVVCQTTGMGFAAVARVTPERWIACAVLDRIDFGLKPGGELKVETTICHEIRQSGQPVIIDHVSEDEVFCGHPTPAMYGFESYISMPIILADGTFFGTLCAIDPRPAQLRQPKVVGMFRLFAELIAVHVDARRHLIAADQRLSDSRSALLDERSASDLREQFIAVLGHDLRNPLASIAAGTQMLGREPQTDKAKTILTMMTASVQRMGGLIDNILDFARGRLGGGLSLDRRTLPLEPTLMQVVDEIRVAYPDRIIHTDFRFEAPYHADHARLAQLFSNLVGNAVTHGAEDQPILVEGKSTPDGLSLSVANGGSPIPEADMERLFQPFYRGEVRSSQQGLGLGLFIASEIARAHDGRLEVQSTPAETRFTLELPL